MMLEAFLQAIQEMRKVRVTFYSHEDQENLLRTCAPMDYAIARKIKDKELRYWFWDYESDEGPHTLPLKAEDIISLIITDEHFDPAEFVTWITAWSIPRDWGKYS